MLQKSDLKVGQWVEYTAPHGDKEQGRIKSWNDKWVFVVYNCAEEWERFEQYTAAATNRDDLICIEEPKTDV